MTLEFYYINDEAEIRAIIKQAVDIGRWAEKSDITYSVLDDDEVEEITENILLQLGKHKYKIVKKE
jgi:hypothetical protein